MYVRDVCDGHRHLQLQCEKRKNNSSDVVKIWVCLPICWWEGYVLRWSKIPASKLFSSKIRLRCIKHDNLCTVLCWPDLVKTAATVSSESIPWVFTVGRRVLVPLFFLSVKCDKLAFFPSSSLMELRAAAMRHFGMWPSVFFSLIKNPIPSSRASISGNIHPSFGTRSLGPSGQVLPACHLLPLVWSPQPTFISNGPAQAAVVFKANEITLAGREWSSTFCRQRLI